MKVYWGFWKSLNALILVCLLILFPSFVSPSSLVSSNDVVENNSRSRILYNDFVVPTRMPLGDGELLIITHEDFLTELEPLVDWKRRTGIPTTLKSWQEFDELFTGWDEAERIKAGIQFHNTGRRYSYVMLVGDAEMFPVRYMMMDRFRYDASQRAGYGVYFGSDLYYADLYGPYGGPSDWDPNDDHIYAELRGEYFTSDPINVEAIDMIPDVAVGRVPASTAIEVRNYVQKVIDYEWHALYSRSVDDWFKKALFIIPWTDSDDLDVVWLETKENIAENSLTPARGFEIIRLYDSRVSGTAASLTDGQPTEASINNSLNAGVGFVNFGGHGNDQAWDNVFFTWSVGATRQVSPKWPIVFSCGCVTGKFCVEAPYEPYIDIFGTSHAGMDAGELWPTSGAPTLPPPTCLQDGHESFPEVLLTYHATKGAVGYLACVTASQAWNKYLDEFFFEAYDEGVTLGDMWQNMVTEYCDASKNVAGKSLGAIGRRESSITSGGDWFLVAGYLHPFKYNLFGDPSLRVGGLTNRPPHSTRYPSHIQIDEGTEYSLNAETWNFIDPDSQPLTYRWDFDGDGTWDTHWLSYTIRLHTFEDDFDGDVFIQASDGVCLSEPRYRPVTVDNVAPTVGIRAPSYGRGGTPIYFGLSITDPGADTFTYEWEFGEWANPQTSDAHYPTVTFSTPAGALWGGESEVYLVNVTVMDDDGGVGEASWEIRISPPSLLDPLVPIAVITGIGIGVFFIGRRIYLKRRLREEDRGPLPGL